MYNWETILIIVVPGSCCAHEKQSKGTGSKAGNSWKVFPNNKINNGTKDI